MTSTLPSRASQREPLALLVDADADTRRMYAEYLRLASGWSVEEAADGREALAKAISRHPAVIITETRLPGMSGFDLCRLLRSDTATVDISIIVVTGDALEADIRRARLAGADAVLVKPCLPDQLHAEMCRVIEQSAEPREASRSPFVLGSETVTPHLAPPAALCPLCDTPLRYIRSHVGGVGKRLREQWDYFECAAGCGTFQYRQRTRKLRKI
jgi:two-component system, cell cycle response regulator DivK